MENQYISTAFRVFQKDDLVLQIDLTAMPLSTGDNIFQSEIELWDTELREPIFRGITYSEFIELILLGIEKKQEMPDEPELAAEITTPAQVAVGNI